MKKGRSRASKRSRSSQTEAEVAARITKKLAARQKIRIELNAEQIRAITDQWKVKAPNMPAEISFHVGPRTAARLKVASYSYWGDTCCA